MLIIQQCIFNQEDFPKINRSTSLNMELEKISTWIKLNKLTLNVEKTTKYMIFHKRRKIYYISLKINNTEIANRSLRVKTSHVQKCNCSGDTKNLFLIHGIGCIYLKLKEHMVF